MKPLVFLGSGISKPSGLPDVSKLTHALFEPAWYKHTDERFYPLSEGDNPCAETRLCQELLRRLMERLTPYYQRHRGTDPNYEDLFFILEQLEHEELAWEENAAIEPFLIEVKKLSRDLCVPPSPVYDDYTFQELASTTKDFIQCVVWRRLSFNGKPQGLELLLDLADLSPTEQLTICTLNHDLLVERLFESASVPIVDGFPERNEDLRFFERSQLQQASTGVVLLKLHGSINWWRMRPDNGDPYDDKIAIPAKPIRDCHSESGVRFSELASHPEFLTGSFNKIVSYGAGISLALMDEFNHALEQHQYVLMSGYGWGDKGINMRLKNWLWGNRQRKIVLLHEEPEQLRASKGLWASFEDFVSDGKLVPIRKWLCDTSLNDVRAVMPL